MAWAERLPSGKYRGKYRDHASTKRTVKGPDGRTRLFTHKAEAVRVAASKEGDARKSIFADPDAAKRTWGEWCTEWWPTREVEPGTAQRDASRRDKHLTPKWETTPLGAIRRHDVKAWARSLLASGLSPSTVQRILHLFSASLSAAIDAEILEANPASRIKLPAGAQAVERYLTTDEFEAIAAELPTLHDWLIAQFLVNTGLRWGEMAGMHMHRAVLDRGIVSVQETYDEKTHRIKAYPKGRRARIVPVPSWLADALGDVTRSGNRCGVPHTVGRCRSGLLFTTARGKPMRDSNWSTRVWGPAVVRAGLSGVRVHDLRHTYASWLLQAGRPLSEVGKLMGHVSSATTDKYAWLADIDAEDVLSALPAAPDLPHSALLPTQPEG